MLELEDATCQRDAPLRRNLYVTGVGEQWTVPLADGSVMKLNTSSRVRIRYSGSERRVVLLQGQAQFSVARDSDRPFIVNVGQGEVRALGTVFDVYQRPKDIVVTLFEGRVEVVPEHESAPLTLEPGEKVTFGEPGQPPRRASADLKQASAWHDRKLIFADTPLREAIAEANRYSGVKIQLRAPAFEDTKISGVFEAGRNEDLAEGLQAYLGLQMERSGEAIVLTENAH